MYNSVFIYGKITFMKHYSIPIFIPELACPHQCVYCNQRKISGTIKSPDIDEVRNIIDEWLTTIDPLKSHVEIAFFGGNFTGIEIEQQKLYLETVKPYLAKGIKGIRMSTRPDYITKEILQFLKPYKITTIELGAQSLDKEVLLKSGRGHTVEDIEKASKLIIDVGIELGLQMMTGLPGDTREKCIKTAKKIVKLGAKNTRIYPTLVINDTWLAEMFKQGEYKPQSMEEAVDWSKDLFHIFNNAGVKIIKMGLHPSEGLMSGEDLLAGPFHVGFRELVMTSVYNDHFKDLQENKDSNLTIYVPKGHIAFAVGHERKNKLELIKKFKSVKFLEDRNLTSKPYYADYS